MANQIMVQTKVLAPIDKVWEYWNNPEHISGWAYAADDWQARGLENDLRVGGKFKTVMSAKDNSTSFDFTGVYTMVKEFELIEYDMGDGRHVKVEFLAMPDGVSITETFDAENKNSEDKQQAGWQAILNNFKKYVEERK